MVDEPSSLGEAAMLGAGSIEHRETFEPPRAGPHLTPPPKDMQHHPRTEPPPRHAAPSLGGGGASPPGVGSDAPAPWERRAPAPKSCRFPDFYKHPACPRVVISLPAWYHRTFYLPPIAPLGMHSEHIQPAPLKSFSLSSGSNFPTSTSQHHRTPIAVFLGNLKPKHVSILSG